MAVVDIGVIVTGANMVGSAVKSAASDIKNLGDNAQATANRLKAIQVVIAGIVVEKGLQIGKALFEAAAAGQLAALQLASVAGGMQNAAKISDDLRAKLGGVFPIENIDAALVKFRTVGLTMDQSTKLTIALGDAISHMPIKDKAGELDNLSTSFERMAIRGYASSREITTSLAGTGIKTEEVAKAMGLSWDNFTTELGKGQISATKFITAFTQVAEQKFGGTAQLFNFTLTGAVQQFENRFKEAMESVEGKTDVVPRFTATINNLADATVKWMASIKQTDIDDFFNTMQSMESVGSSLITTLVDVGKATKDIGVAAADILGKMPGDATEYGIVGYVLGGKKFALIAVVMDTIITKLRLFNSESEKTQAFMTGAVAFAVTKNPWVAGIVTFGDIAITNLKTLDAQYNALAASAAKAGATNEQFNDVIQKTIDSSGVMSAKMGALELYRLANGESGILSMDLYGKNGPAALNAHLIATKAQAEALAKALTVKITPGLDVGNTDETKPGVDPTARINALKVATNDLLQNLGDQVTQIADKASGDTFQSAIQGINDTTGKYLAQLNDAYIKWENIKGVSDSMRSTVLNAILNMEGQVVNATEQEKQHITEINNAKKQELALDAQVFAAQQAITNATLQTNLALLQSHEAAFQSGTAGGQLQTQVLQQQLQYTLDIAQANQKIHQLQDEMASDPNNAALAAKNNSEIAGLTTQIQLTTKLGAATTVMGTLMKNAFQEAGQVLENDVANGISGLIMKTETLGDVMRSIFSDMISMLVKYLMQMVEVAVFSKASQAASLAITAPTAAATAAMWGPAAMAASIASFGGADVAGAAGFESAMALSLVPFALGGVPGLSEFSNAVLTGPTLFGMAGEAGEEAIMPLTRIGGKLGVRAEGGSADEIHFHIHANDTQTGMQFIDRNIDHIVNKLAARKRLNRG